MVMGSTPTHESEVLSLIADSLDIRVYCGEATLRPFFPSGAATLSLENFVGIVDRSVPDQVVTVRTGTRLSDFQAMLAADGQWLPYQPAFEVGDVEVGHLLALGWPHLGESTFGTWRDWVLGMRVALHDGSVAKVGSKVVKNVAGYDIHRFLIGSRYRFAIPLEVTFRVRTLTSELECTEPVRLDGSPWIQRVLARDIPELRSQLESRRHILDACTNTVFALLNEGEQLQRFEEDWAISASLPFLNPMAALEQRLFESMDPDQKFSKWRD